MSEGFFCVRRDSWEALRSAGLAETRVFLEFCNMANAEGFCWPSATRLAERLAVHRTTVFRAITVLESMGLVRRSSGKGSKESNTYQIVSASGLNSSVGATVQPSNSSVGATRIVACVQPNSSVGATQNKNHEQEPRTRGGAPTKPKSGKPKPMAFKAPTLKEVQDYCRERRNQVDPDRWLDHYTANGWKVGKNPMRDWRAAVRTWEKNGISKGHRPSEIPPSFYRDLTPIVNGIIKS